MRTVALAAEPLTADAFGPYGWIPVPDTDPADGEQTLTYAWADPHLNTIEHTFEEIEHGDDGAPHCDRFYRHDSHTQALMPLNVDAVVAVAPSATEFRDLSDLDDVRAFLLHPQDCFVLHRGTWHWGPFPLGPEPVRLLNVQGRRYADDNASVVLPEAVGAVISVVVP
jgi:ureidoglycolate hydrolase